MHFYTITLLSLTALSAAAPVAKRQGSVLGSTTYNDISISGGTAGNAEAEALAIFANLDTANPENISKEDQKALNEVNQVANDAETEAFNPAIEAATGEEADALQVCPRQFLLKPQPQTIIVNLSVLSIKLTDLFTARQDKEQGSQARSHCSQAPGPTSPGYRCEREAC